TLRIRIGPEASDDRVALTIEYEPPRSIRFVIDRGSFSGRQVPTVRKALTVATPLLRQGFFKYGAKLFGVPAPRILARRPSGVVAQTLPQRRIGVEVGDQSRQRRPIRGVCDD